MADQAKAQPKKDIKYIVRIANTDLVGSKQILIALRKIKGVGIMIANTVLAETKINPLKKAGELTEQEVSQLNSAFSKIEMMGLPSWLMNRRKDYETGEDRHLLQADLKFTKDSDIKRLSKIKSRRGIRHALKLPLRGQRTKSNFRRNKGKGSLGVQRKKDQGGKK